MYKREYVFITSLPLAMKDTYVLCKQQYVLRKKYRSAYKSITTHP